MEVTDPVGIKYLKTYQAVFQLSELLVGLLSWSMTLSQYHNKVHPIHFAVGSLILAWCISLAFFIIYISAAHMRINIFFKTDPPEPGVMGESTTRSLAPLSGETIPNVRWFVVEYTLYFASVMLLLISCIIISVLMKNNNVLIAAACCSWLLFMIYMIHFCLLFRNIESRWPHQWCYSCSKRLKKDLEKEYEELKRDYEDERTELLQTSTSQ